ncbi:MAG: LysM peptidoglycan-binding domain-containing protein, partial [Candidatus Cryptobacteroides sp.]
MKKLITTAAIAFAFCLIPCGSGLLAQEYKAPEVTLSKETVKLDGKIYYSHIVLEKQTLYSISKAYGVTMDEIYEANQNLKETGLKKNAIILIPAKDKAATAAREEQQSTVKEETVRNEEVKPAAKEEKREDRKKGKNPDYFIHTVKWYENLDDIAAKYGMTTESLMKYNSLKDRKLTRRQKLRIPTEPQNFTPEEEEQEVVETPAETAAEEV